MAHLIDKDALVAMIEKKIELNTKWRDGCETLAFLAANEAIEEDKQILSIINTLKVKEVNSIVNPYDACIQYTNRESAIKAHAEVYSWNIESELFQQLTPEQQKLWRKEIEQTCISGGYSGLNLAKDPRYKENLEVKEIDLEKEMDKYFDEHDEIFCRGEYLDYAKHFFELGLKVVQKG